MSAKQLIILGIGGTSRDVADVVFDLNDASDKPCYDLLGFLDDNEAMWGKEVRGHKVLGPLKSARDYQDAYFVNGIGSEKNFRDKEAILSRLGIADEQFETLIHPSVIVSRSSTIGAGSVLYQNVVIQSQARIGRQVALLPFAGVAHDVEIGDYTIVSAYSVIIGYVRVGRACYLGVSSSIMRNIGDGAVVGMGSVVINEVGPNQVVVGNPARVLRNVR